MLIQLSFSLGSPPSVTFSSFTWCAVCIGVLFCGESWLTSLPHVFQHHSYRSFLGLTCLMQISTRTEDFIIDTLELRSDMNILNETFTDPAIVKVSCQIHKPTIRIPVQPGVEMLFISFSICFAFQGSSWCRFRCGMAAKRLWPVLGEHVRYPSSCSSPQPRQAFFGPLAKAVLQYRC